MKLLNSATREKAGVQVFAAGLILAVLTGCAEMNAIGRVQNVNDPALLAKIAVEDEAPAARHVATDKLTDQALLEKIAVEDKVWFVRCAAVNNTALRNRTLLARIAGNDEDFNVRRAADSRLGRDSLLAVYGLVTTPLEKVARTTDQTALTKIALEDKDNEVRAAAADKLVDQALLAKLAREDSSFQVRAAVIEKLTDQALLETIATTDPHVLVRAAAAKKLVGHERLKFQVDLEFTDWLLRTLQQ